jgi:uncharacterized protein YqjF (DUF2071 family)
VLARLLAHDGIVDDDGVGVERGRCPFVVRRPVMLQRWGRLTFLHWRYQAGAVQSLLPPGLTVETFDGSAWVGLVPFRMTVGAPGGATLPWASRFCETNVRTYVRDQEGRTGIWFLSLDAERLGAVVTARTAYRLPYFWSRMRLFTDGPVVRYRCSRRWPGPAGVRSLVSVETGAAYEAAEVTPLDHFVTARWVLFSVAGSRHRYARAQHPPWPLRRARLLDSDDGLVEAAGLPRPVGEPLVHYSDGVQVRIGMPQKYQVSPG